MKKDNSGFTLIEILAVITILAILSVVVGFSVTGMLSRQEEDKYVTYKKDLEKAACVYAQKRDECNSGCTVTPKDLVADGLIKKNIINPSSGDNVENDNAVITVKFVNGERICEYSSDE